MPPPATRRPTRARSIHVVCLLGAALAAAGCRSESAPPASPAAPRAPAADAAPRQATPASAPRLRPTSPSAAGTCSNAGCHDSYAQADFVHAPAAQQACDVCHGAEQPGHRFPLRRAVNDTCLFCHPVFTGKPFRHQVVVSGHCTVCHDPHAAGHKFLFREPVAERCATCHPPQDRAVDHPPYAAGACNACHMPHEATNPHLTIADGADNCYRCHAGLRSRLAAATTRHPPVDANCSTCHEPHSAAQPGLLRQPQSDLCLGCHPDIAATVRTATETHGALLVEKGCANCHDPHGSGEPRLLKDRIAALCLQCHDRPQIAGDGRTIRSVKTEVADSEFLHGPVRQGDCQACHQVHGSSNARLLAKTFPEGFYQKFDAANYALCFSCHEQAMVLEDQATRLTGFRNGDRNLHRVHVAAEKGRTCRACHAIHGSDLPKHMASSVPFDNSGWSLPIGFQKTATGGSCAPGCHAPLAYDRDTPVTYPTATRPR